MKRKFMCWAFAAALAVSLPVRIYQQLLLVDRSTGFYTDGNVSSAIVTVFLFAGTVAVIVFGQLGKKQRGSSAYSPITCGFTAVLGILTGVMMIVQAIMSMMRVASAGSQALTEEEMIAAGAQHPLLYSFLALVEIAAAIVVILTASDAARGQNMFRRYPVATLLPQLWGCVNLIVMFVKFTEVVNTAENLYDMFFMIFLLLFFSAQSKLLSGIDEERNYRLVLEFGLPAVLFGLATSVPDLIAGLAGAAPFDQYILVNGAVCLLLSLYALSYLSALLRSQGISGKIECKHTEKA